MSVRRKAGLWMKAGHCNRSRVGWGLANEAGNCVSALCQCWIPVREWQDLCHFLLIFQPFASSSQLQLSNLTFIYMELLSSSS